MTPVPVPRPRILLVDDDRAFCELMDVWLGTRFELEVAHDGEQGVARAKLERPDAILLDVMMPRLSGFSLAWVFKHDPFFAGVPVIYCTAHAAEWPDPQEALSRADAYLLKPFGIGELTGVLERLLQAAPSTVAALAGGTVDAGPRREARVPASLHVDDGAPSTGTLRALTLWGALHEPESVPPPTGAAGKLRFADSEGPFALDCRVLGPPDATPGVALRLRFPDQDQLARYHRLFQRSPEPHV